ncbi:hypothetical protein PARPLA_01673 [Rhodobacteraceae bacterium THAF1]|nr:hypothetical protein FIU81_09020 [Palleronia sp. THAF1]VDC23948.1 hypothetical protein PARPLA_01673 [Rhodobacteraceae bacterium THAF1]
MLLRRGLSDRRIGPTKNRPHSVAFRNRISIRNVPIAICGLFRRSPLSGCAEHLDNTSSPVDPDGRPDNLKARPASDAISILQLPDSNVLDMRVASPARKRPCLQDRSVFGGYRPYRSALLEGPPCLPPHIRPAVIDNPARFGNKLDGWEALLCAAPGDRRPFRDAVRNRPKRPAGTRSLGQGAEHTDKDHIEARVRHRSRSHAPSRRTRACSGQS